jgi:hypothetical protein
MDRAFRKAVLFCAEVPGYAAPFLQLGDFCGLRTAVQSFYLSVCAFCVGWFHSNNIGLIAIIINFNPF